MRSYTMIVVRDVEASAAWYSRLLDARSDHGGSEFDMIVKDGELLLMLHHLDTKEHRSLGDPAAGGPGHGVLIYFHVDDVDEHHRRALEIGADVIDEPHENPLAHQFEFSLRDPDGYALTICKPIAI